MSRKTRSGASRSTSVDAFFAGGRQHHLVALVLEDHLQRVADRGLVVDDEDAWFHRVSVRTVRMVR